MPECPHCHYGGKPPDWQPGQVWRGKPLSPRAIACPNCGHPLPELLRLISTPAEAGDLQKLYGHEDD